MQKTLHKIFFNQHIHNSIIMVGGNLLVSFLNYLFLSYSARLIGPALYSELSSFFSVVFLVSIPLQSILFILIRKSLEQENPRIFLAKVEQWFKSQLFHNLGFLLTIIFAGAIALSYILRFSLSTEMTLFAVIILSVLSIFYLGALQTLKQFFAYNVVLFVAALFKNIFLIIPIEQSLAYSLILVCVLLSYLSQYLLAYILYPKPQEAYFTTKINKSLLSVLLNRHFLEVFLSLLGMNLITYIDVILSRFLFTPVQAGYYSAWILFARIVLYLLMPISTLLYTLFADQKEKQHRRFLLWVSLFAYFITGFIVYELYNFFGSLFITLIFGPKFIAILPLLPQAAIFGTIYSIISLLTNYLVSQKNPLSLITLIYLLIALVPLFNFHRSWQIIIHLNIYLGAIIIFGLTIGLLFKKTE